MPIAFGPELVGQTEKTLSALLLRSLEGTDLTEPQWVTLRLAEIGGDDDLPTRVLDRAGSRMPIPSSPASPSVASCPAVSSRTRAGP